MADPLHERSELEKTLAFAAETAARYLAGIDDEPVRRDNADEAALAFGGPLPEEGDGALGALVELVERGTDATIASAGPRFFHWVIGGGTPAAVAADWLASAFDQVASAWDSSPLANQLEAVSLGWLNDLFDLPRSWGGVMTTGATMANLTGLAAARRWYGERHGVEVDEQGLVAVPPVPVLSSGYIHPSSVKALTMLGIGRASVRRFQRDVVGRLDVEGLADALRRLRGAPAIVVANAGEVNAGDFDPIAEMADLAEEHGAWLHVDGAFGLFARVVPQARSLTQGVERAQSVTIDAHKWLNVPYDCGFSFVHDPSALPKTFGVTAAYLPSLDESRPSFGYFGPEMSRRARSFAVWATLRAYGRSGYRAMVERHLGLAQRVAERVREAPDLELLADVKLNIVCFRFRPPDLGEDELNELNQRLGEAVLADGRVYVGTTTYGGRIAFRPAIVNWRTTEADVDLLVDVIRELGARLLAPAATGARA